MRRLAILLILIGAYLFIRDLRPRYWSAWRFDPQVMLAVRNWQKEGVLSTNYLFIPQGYSHLSPLFDEPRLSHHAHGSGREFKEQRAFVRVYTHYPVWFTLPYVVLGKLGIYDKSIYQMVASSISLASLVFFYLFLTHFFTSNVALLTVGIYALSPFYLRYIDSLCGLSCNDFSRFLFLYLWTKFSRSPKYGWTPYLVYFGAMMVTIDSIAFIPLWALFDLLHRRERFARPILAFAGIAAFALFLSLWQNSFYRGWAWAIWDWKTLLQINSLAAESAFSLGSMMWERCASIAWGWSGATRLEVIPSLLLLTTGFGVVAWVVPAFRYVGTGLFIAGCGFALVFPKKGIMDYETAQFAPLVALLFSVAFFVIVKELRTLFSRPFIKSAATSVLAAAFVLPSTGYLVKAIPDLSVQTWIDDDVERCAEFVATLHRAIPGEKIVFQNDLVFPTTLASPGFPQVLPLMEYEADAPILSFEKSDDLIRDLNTLWSERKQPITFVVVTTKGSEEQIVNQLRTADKVGRKIPFETYPGISVLEVTAPTAEKLTRSAQDATGLVLASVH